MPTITMAPGTSQSIGPLSENTAFRVLSGRVSVSTAAIAANNVGFSLQSRDDLTIGSGKTAYLKSTGGCKIHYESLI